MCLSACEPLGSQWTEVLDVVCDHGAAFPRRDLDDVPVVAAEEIFAFADRYDIVAALTEHRGNSRRELLVEQSPHGRTARSPLVAALRPRSYSASFSAISSSISSLYSP